MTVPRPEYPRPHFERNRWLNLNGDWEFAFDDGNVGLAEKWFEGHALARRIIVPFPFQSVVSGIADTRFHDVVWYARTVTVPAEWAGEQVLLHFGAVDYRAWVWVNGQFVVYHEGGHTPFSAEISALLQAGDNRITVRVEDISTDIEQPRGKQYWEEKSAAIFYTRTTGIWQTVWLEPVGRAYLEKIQFTPDIDAGEVKVEYRVNGLKDGQSVRVEVRFGEQVVAMGETPAKVLQNEAVLNLKLQGFGAAQLWSPDQPNLFYATASVQQDGQTLDSVNAYFGMRKIAVVDGRVMFNNQPYTMKLVLDQGYYPDGILAAPTDFDMKRDVMLTKAMGFNGARKHQKIEDPRYLYWADQLGLLVWGEMANAFTFSDRAVRRVMAEFQAEIERDYNHPCIVAWVPLNESWGVADSTTDSRQPSHATALYYMVKSLDRSRLVVSNDGWEHSISDLCTIHDYTDQPDVINTRYATAESSVSATPANRVIYSPGYAYRGEPILLTEFGGIGYRKSDWEGWGYSTAQNDEDFVARYKGLTEAVLKSPTLQGFCYTQLTDVEQEINGLLTYDRQPKVDPELIRAINEGL